MPSKYTPAQVRAMSDRELRHAVNRDVMGLYPFDLDSACPATDMNAAMEAVAKITPGEWRCFWLEWADGAWLTAFHTLDQTRSGVCAEHERPSRAISEACLLTVEGEQKP